MQQMYRFGIDVMFGSGNFCGNKQSQGQGRHAKFKSQRAKIIVWGTSTGHGKYAVMVWCQSYIYIG